MHAYQLSRSAQQSCPSGTWIKTAFQTKDVKSMSCTLLISRKVALVLIQY